MIRGGFGDHRDFQFAGCQMLFGQLQFQALEAVIVEQAFHLVRRAGQQNHQAALAFKVGVKPLPGRGAAGVFQKLRPVDVVSLLYVVFRHAHAHDGGARVEGRYDLVIAAQLQTQGLGNAFARQIILGGTEASGKYDNLGTRECGPAGLQADARDGRRQWS